MTRKIPLRSDAFDLLKAEQRARAFRIAGLNKASLIQKAQNELSKAIRDRTAFRDVRMNLLAMFKEAGIEAPSMNHLRIVMRQNMNTVDAVARMRTLESPAVRRRFPYLRYITALDSGVRPTHAALHGKIFRADDPFFKTRMPPWGWGCRCSVIPVSDRELKRLKIDVWTAADADREGIKPEPQFAFPRDQLKSLDKAVLRGFQGDLKRFIEQRFAEADQIEAAGLTSAA
jgi:SPP1 gp7 family putative phage head morphogenesis protein